MSNYVRGVTSEMGAPRASAIDEGAAATKFSQETQRKPHRLSRQPARVARELTAQALRPLVHGADYRNGARQLMVASACRAKSTRARMSADECQRLNKIRSSL